MKRLSTLLLLCLPQITVAQIYRWVDAGGQVHFSQKPPVSGVFENVTPPSTPAPAPAAKQPAAVNSDASLRLRADNAERCAKARERTSFLEAKTASRLYKTGDDGQPAALTQAEFDQQLADARAAGLKYCE